jgi:hypothetical protein
MYPALGLKGTKIKSVCVSWFIGTSMPFELSSRTDHVELATLLLGSMCLVGIASETQCRESGR